MELPDGVLMDLACGIASSGTKVTDDDAGRAKAELHTRGYSDADITVFEAQRTAELIRDESGLIVGCSTPDCDRPASWLREFRTSLNGGRLLANIAAAAVTAHVSLFVAGPENFDGYRLGKEDRELGSYAIQYGCWSHISSFVSVPQNSSFVYAVTAAVLPAPPHAVFGITDEIWRALKTAEAAQNLGEPQGPRGYCSSCGLPHCLYTLKGIKSGEGDDYWKTFCEYCGSEVSPADDVL